jgi:hypothetical protein
MRDRAYTPDLPCPIDTGQDGAAARPSRWRALLHEWLRYAALGHDMPLFTAAELAQHLPLSPGANSPRQHGGHGRASAPRSK